MWLNKQLTQLSAKEFYEIERLRINTFVVEQNRIYHDLDDVDERAYHLACFDNEQCLAYARIFENGDYLHFGRVATALSARGKGYGGELIRRILAFCDEKWPGPPIEIEAQEQVVGLYEKFGFEPVGDRFILEGTPHQKMIKK